MKGKLEINYKSEKKAVAFEKDLKLKLVQNKLKSHRVFSQYSGFHQVYCSIVLNSIFQLMKATILAEISSSHYYFTADKSSKFLTLFA